MNCKDKGCEAKHNNKNQMCVFQEMVVLHGQWSRFEFTIEHLKEM